MVWTHWQSDACAELRCDEMKGGLWAWEAPGEVLRSGDSYAVYQVISGDVDYTNTSLMDMYLIQFSLYDNSDNAGQVITNLRDYWTHAWDDVELTIDNNKFGDVQRLINL